MQNKKFTVADYMRREMTTLSGEATLREAVALMLERKTNGLVITNDDRKVVGILSSWDILHLIVPDYLEDDKHLASFESGDVFIERVRECADILVKTFMTKEVHSVKESHTVMEATTLLTEYRIRQLPVTNEAGQLVGHLSRTDIKRAIGDALDLPVPPRD